LLSVNLLPSLSTAKLSHGRSFYLAHCIPWLHHIENDISGITV
jgi:hypothetical protein